MTLIAYLQLPQFVAILLYEDNAMRKFWTHERNFVQKDSYFAL